MDTKPTSNWGTATFDSEAAIHWVEGFLQDPSVAALEFALDGSTALVDDVDVSQVVLAAAEVVAAWSGRPAADLPVSLTPWMMGRSQPLPRDLVTQAHAATMAVGRSSALRELWRERKKLEAWEGEVLALTERLGSRP